MFAAPQLASTRLPVFSPPCPLYLTPRNHASLLGQCLPRCLCSVLMLRQLLSLPSQPFFSPRLLTHDGGPFRSRRPRGVGGCSLCRAQRRAVQNAAHVRCAVDPPYLRFAKACPGEGGVGCTSGGRAGCTANCRHESRVAPAKAGPAEQLAAQPAVPPAARLLFPRWQTVVGLRGENDSGERPGETAGCTAGGVG